MTAPRMRTAPEAIAEIKAVDPKTALTERALRRMINSGELPSVNIGNKKLVNLDKLFEYLNGESSDLSASSPQSKIRRIG